MPAPSTKTNRDKKKIYFVYFIVFSIIILLIFAIIIIGSFWDYWSQLSQIENFYKNRALTSGQKYPQINSYDPTKGDPQAQVTVFEYSDIFCTSCQNLNQDLSSLEDFYGNRVKFVFKGLPITNNPETEPALIAAYCAGDQNHFWDYKDLLFENYLTLNNQKYLEYAKQLNLNLDNFNNCLTSQKYQSLINQNLSEALTLQITSVPTIYVNKQKLEGFMDYNSLKKVIDQQL